MKNILATCIIFILLACIVFSQTETPTGTFSVGNSAPSAPHAWIPATTHDKSQAFSWTEGYDANGDEVSTYICISSDSDDDSCDVLNQQVSDPSYTFMQSEPNWDYLWGTAQRDYYVKLTPNDGTENGTSNSSISFTLTDAIPTISGQTSDASADGNKDVGNTITFSMSSHSDTDAEDSHNLRICKTDEINTSGECPGGEYCNEHGDSYSDDSSLSCQYTAQQADSTSNTAYFFVCDCPSNDNSCPGQCSSPYAHTFYVNHAPSASSVSISPSSPTSSQDLVCDYSFSDTDGDDEGSSGFKWYKFSGTWQETEHTSKTLDSSAASLGEQWKCEVTPIDEHNLEGSAVQSDPVTILNTPPGQPTGLEIQDSESHWDSESLDTHDQTPNLRWSTSDTDEDTVTTHICIAASGENRNDNNCDAYSASTSSGSIGEISGLDYSGTNRTYYIRLTPDDGTENGTPLDAEFYLLNSIPQTPSGLTPLSTHNQTPTLSWTAADADDGSQDHWPADSLTYHIRVGTSYGDSTYENNDNADKTGETVDNPIPWGTPGEDWANNTVYARIWTTDGNNGGVSDNYDTQINLYNDLPDITDIEMTDSGSAYSSCTSSTCALSPIENSDARVAARVTAVDTDQDCDTQSSAYLYLCLNNISCSPSSADYNWHLDSIQRDGDECTYTFSSNKTDGLEFFQLPDDSYKIYVNVSDQAGQKTADPENTASWTYGTLKSIDYPSTVTLGDESIDLGQWNPGTTSATMTNWGNSLLSLQWAATDPVSGEDTWNLNGTDFQIDDDLSHENEDSGTISPVFLNQTPKVFEPVSGLQVCSTSSCDDPSLAETLDTYFHIAPPAGLAAGTYNSTITITIS